MTVLVSRRCNDDIGHSRRFLGRVRVRTGIGPGALLLVVMLECARLHRATAGLMRAVAAIVRASAYYGGSVGLILCFVVRDAAMYR